MRLRIVRACAVVVVACATAFTGLTPAAAHDLDSDRFQVALRPGAEHYEDVGREGPSIGDYFVSRDKVYHRGNRVGRLNFHCYVTRAGAGRFAYQCDYNMFLRGRGTIAMQGLLAFSEKGPHGEPALAIIGGTGWYVHASGTATVVEHFMRIDMR